jgi:phage tail sheath protein FI
MHPWGEEVAMGKKKNKGKGGKGSHYLTPGVYVEEVPSAGKPIEGVGTSVAAFVGLSPFSPGRLARTLALATVVTLLVRKLR